MIRCRVEVNEQHVDKKLEDSRESFVIAARRMSFDELARRDADQWRRITDAEELRRATSRARRELAAGELAHYVAWVCAQHGAGLARAAGLPIAPLRIQLAS